MTLKDIAARLQKGLDRRPLEHSIKFDCGADGAITLDGAVAELADGVDGVCSQPSHFAADCRSHLMQ